MKTSARDSAEVDGRGCSICQRTYVNCAQRVSAAHLNRPHAPAVRGVHALIYDVAAAVVVVRIGVAVGMVVIGIVIIVAVGIEAVAQSVVPKVVIVTSPPDGTGAKAAEAAAVVSDGGAGAKTMEAADRSPAKTAGVKATSKSAATKAASVETAATTTKTAATVTAAKATAAATASAATSQCHGWRGQSNGGNGQQHDYSLSQHHHSPSDFFAAQPRHFRWRFLWSIPISIGITTPQLGASLS